jgi:DNA-binding transcriptional MerR regulator
MVRNELLIGDAAKRSGLSRNALRLYEARGIIPSAERARKRARAHP